MKKIEKTWRIHGKDIISFSWKPFANWKHQLIDMIEILFNKGIPVIATTKVILSGEIYWFIILILSLMFTLKIDKGEK